jgi:hypothetical protein
VPEDEAQVAAKCLRRKYWEDPSRSEYQRFKPQCRSVVKEQFARGYFKDDRKRWRELGERAFCGGAVLKDYSPDARFYPLAAVRGSPVWIVESRGDQILKSHNGFLRNPLVFEILSQIYHDRVMDLEEDEPIEEGCAP